MTPSQATVKALSLKRERRQWLWRWETLAATLIFAGGGCQIGQYWFMATDTTAGLTLSWTLAGMVYMALFAWISIFPKGFGTDPVNLRATKFLWPAVLSFLGGFATYLVNFGLILLDIALGRQEYSTAADNQTLLMVIILLVPALGYKHVKNLALHHPVVVGFLAAALMAIPVIIMAMSLTPNDGGVTWFLITSGLLVKSGRLLEFGLFRPVNQADARVRKLVLTGESIRLLSWVVLTLTWLSMQIGG